MPTPQRQQRIANVVAARQQGVVVIENIHDPHNAEAVIRSCDAFGIQKICLIFLDYEPFDPQAIGKLSSSSANKWLDFATYHSTEACLSDLKQQGYELIATVLDEQAESLYSAQLTTPKIALLLGNEHKGLSSTACKLADRAITIPMQGMVQSLNLSVTASIILYEITRQRLAQGIERYRLPPDEQQRLRQNFLER